MIDKRRKINILNNQFGTFKKIKLRLRKNFLKNEVFYLYVIY